MGEYRRWWSVEVWSSFEDGGWGWVGLGWKGKITGLGRGGVGHDESFIRSTTGTSPDQVGLEDLEHSFPRAGCGVRVAGAATAGLRLACRDED
jgi:hypothetical protein